MKNIYVFHNLSALAQFRGLNQGDEMKVVHHSEISRDFASEGHMLKVLFSWFNHGSGATLKEYQPRSMSVGDVLSVSDGKTQTITSYAVTISGWLKLDKPITNNGPYGYERGRGKADFDVRPIPQTRTC